MNLEKHFEHIGAQLKIQHVSRIGFREPRNFDINIHGNGRNEHFVIRVTNNAPEFNVLQSNKAARHLLLMAKTEIGNNRFDTDRFLCGHDERHWFAASVNRPVSTVTEARRALLPRDFAGQEFTPDELAQRHNAKFKRQGEWFFVPADVNQMAKLKGKSIHRSEPLVRPGGGKPHLVSELIRFGGQQVYVQAGKEYTPAEWFAIDEIERKRNGRANLFTKDAEVYVRGPIRHPDHATLILPDWHRVFVNGEVRSGSLSFYD